MLYLSSPVGRRCVRTSTMLSHLAKREIQRYRASAKDYRVGIITSDLEYWEGPQSIRYFPLSDRFDKALEVLDRVQLRPYYEDIQLNAIQYALERCAFRPDAQRRLIAFGNDIPICGGYSPLSIIERCRALGVVLDIHGADAAGRLHVWHRRREENGFTLLRTDTTWKMLQVPAGEAPLIGSSKLP